VYKHTPTHSKFWCVCCFVLLTRYWGIVTVPGCPRVNKPGIITWGGRILTLHLNNVAGYTCPLLFLFERTHNYYVDSQGLVPWRLRRLGKSKVRLASLVKVLGDGKIFWILWILWLDTVVHILLLSLIGRKLIFKSSTSLFFR